LAPLVAAFAGMTLGRLCENPIRMCRHSHYPL